MRKSITLAGAALAALATAGAAQAAVVLPLATGSATFSGDRIAGGPSPSACDAFFVGLGSASCPGQAFHGGGPDGGFIITGAADRFVSITAGPGGSNPTAKVHVTLNGGDSLDGRPDTGAGAAGAEAQLDYYVTVLPLANPPPTTPADIPLAFIDAGSVDASMSSQFGAEGEASTGISAFTGKLSISALTAGSDVALGGADNGASLFLTYGHSRRVDFLYNGNPLDDPPVAEVTLDAQCELFAETAGFGSGTCDASADPFVGFDQADFDKLMGANTFNLSDYFEIVLSPGLEPAAGVPEPSSWVLMIAGLGLAGAALRRRRRALCV